MLIKPFDLNTVYPMGSFASVMCLVRNPELTLFCTRKGDHTGPHQGHGYVKLQPDGTFASQVLGTWY